MNVRWTSRFARTPPPSASTRKGATCARARKATEETGLTVWVSVCAQVGGWRRASENHEMLWVWWAKERQDITRATYRLRLTGVVWPVHTDICQFLVQSQACALVLCVLH